MAYIRIRHGIKIHIHQIPIFTDSMAVFWGYSTYLQAQLTLRYISLVGDVRRSESTASPDVSSGWTGSGVAHAILCHLWCTIFFALTGEFQGQDEIISGIIDTSWHFWQHLVSVQCFRLMKKQILEIPIQKPWKSTSTSPFLRFLFYQPHSKFMRFFPPVHVFFFHQKTLEFHRFHIMFP